MLGPKKLALTVVMRKLIDLLNHLLKNLNLNPSVRLLLTL